MADARRHLLSIDHTRSKNQYQLKTSEFEQLLKHAIDQPKDLSDLARLIAVKDETDIERLDDSKFFDLSSDNESELVSHMIPILFQNEVDYRISSLPKEVQQAFFQAVDKHKKIKRNA